LIDLSLGVMYGRRAVIAVRKALGSFSRKSSSAEFTLLKWPCRASESISLVCLVTLFSEPCGRGINTVILLAFYTSKTYPKDTLSVGINIKCELNLISLI